MSGKPSCVRSESKRARSFASTQLTKPKEKPRPDVSFPVSDVAAFVMTANCRGDKGKPGKLCPSYAGRFGTGSQDRTDNLTRADAVDRSSR